MEKSEYDLIVVGGGISGSIAAIAAARAGARTLLVEQYGFLGGMLTTAGVGPMMTFHAGGKQVIQGITGELIERLKEKKKSPGHVFDTTGYTDTVTPFDVEGMKSELENMLLAAGGEMLYHAMLAGVDVEDEKGILQSITVCTKAGLSKLRARQFIDATGDADLAFQAGVSCTQGRSGDGACQPMTMKIRMMNVDLEKVRGYIKEHPDEFPSSSDINIIDKGTHLSIGGFVKPVKEARSKGEITFNRESILMFEASNEGEVIINTTRVQGFDSNDPWSLSRAEVEGRRQAAEVERFLKKSIPGFEKSVLVYTGPQIGVRSSRQIVGLHTLSPQDILSCEKFPDTIAHSGYPIDIHNPTGSSEYDSGFQKLEEGMYYGIPFRCLLNDQIGNLITVGRCISADFEAQAAIRTTPTVGAIGHAGGLAAAMAVQQNIPAQDLDPKTLREEIRKQGGYLDE